MFYTSQARDSPDQVLIRLLVPMCSRWELTMWSRRLTSQLVQLWERYPELSLSAMTSEHKVDCQESAQCSCLRCSSTFQRLCLCNFSSLYSNLVSGWPWPVEPITLLLNTSVRFCTRWDFIATKILLAVQYNYVKGKIQRLHNTNIQIEFQ